MCFSCAVVQVFSSLLQKGSEAVLHENFYHFVERKEALWNYHGIVSHWYFGRPLLLHLGTGTSALECPGTSDNRGANTEVKPACPSAEPEQTPLILSSLLLLTKCTAQAHLHSLSSLWSASPLEHVHA